MIAAAIEATARRARYAEQVYASVLGKFIGVYLGRPVEGLPYSEIRDRFGQLDGYVHDRVGAPLIVADDDISGTLTFFRGVEDHRDDLGSSAFGDTWLNYIIENRTILWWGGFGRSTEHTAFTNLKRGMRAPDSGSIAMNGQTLAEQIGAQIFSDAFALVHPGDPDSAVRLTRAAARVSHDGVALDCAGFFAAMRAAAFEEPDLSALIEVARPYATDERLRRVVDEVEAHAQAGMDWRSVRDWVDRTHGYSVYPGPCHSLANTAMTLAALLLGGDSFKRGVMIAASAGFDTDSNAGVVGALNGIRFGLHGIDQAPELRSPIADRAIVVSADGGEAITDAAREANRIIDARDRMLGVGVRRRSRFDFDLPGAVHGFTDCPEEPSSGGAPVVAEPSGGLRFDFTRSNQTRAVSTPTHLVPEETMGNFSTLASPTLYPGDEVEATVQVTGQVRLRLAVLYRSPDGVIVSPGNWVEAANTAADMRFRVPPLGNLAPYRLRLEGRSISSGASVVLRAIDWRGAPNRFEQRGLLTDSIWDTRPAALDAWISSAGTFEADFGATFAIADADALGVATVGTREWVDYRVSTRLRLSIHRAAGVIVRARGHRRFLAALLTGGTMLQLVQQLDRERRVLAELPFDYLPDVAYDVAVEIVGTELTVHLDGVRRLTAVVDDGLGGGAGLIVDRGAFTADGFLVESRGRAESINKEGTT